MRTEEEIIDEKLEVMRSMKEIQVKQNTLLEEVNLLFYEIENKLNLLKLLEDDPEEYFNLKYNG